MVNRPLMRNYIRDSSGAFSISFKLVRMDIYDVIYHFYTVVCAKILLSNSKKIIARRLENNFLLV